jgi:nucleoside-diphosphate-sugar epimerase
LADESHLTFPSTPYTEDKLKIESLIQSSVVKDKFHILRISNIYGDAEISGLFQQLWTSISINQEIVITAELFVRNFVHIDDLYRFLTIQNHDFLHKGRILNFASDSHSNIGETCEKIIAKLNSSSELKYGHKNPEILVSRVSNRKIKESFGFQFKDVSEWIDGISIKYNSGDQAHDH